MNTKYKSVFFRFAKAFISGSLSFMTLVTVFLPKTFQEAQALLISLGFAAFFGGINGIIMAGEKLLLWKE